MPNNSEKIKKYLSFGTDDFYMIQIIKRRKDNPGMPRGEAIIRTFYVESLEQYEMLVPTLIGVCDYENARAYIRLNRRNYKKIGLQVVKRVVDYIASDNNRAIKNVFDSVAGEFSSETDKKWLIDVDDLDNTNVGNVFKLHSICGVLKELQIQTNREPLTDMLLTKSGVHIITRPFNAKTFKEMYPDISIHKSAMTLIYCPDENN